MDKDNVYRQLAFSLFRNVLHHASYPNIKVKLTSLEFMDEEDGKSCKMQVRY